MSTYLVTQATGDQSQWTIEFLLAAGAKVHALVRDPTKLPDLLKRPGVTVFDRENNSPPAIFKAAKGCKGVFLNTFPSFVDVESEGQQARTVLEECKKAGVETVVASTSFYTGDRAKWANDESYPLVGSYYESKYKVEEAVRAANFHSYTILRPAVIQHDYTVPHTTHNFPDLPKTGTLTHTLNDGVGLLHVDERDIGKYAAAALLDPIKFGGQEIEMANELLTMEDVRDIMVKVTGKDVKVKKWTEEETNGALLSVFIARFELWANIHPQKSTAAATAEKFGIAFTSLEEYFEREKTKILASLPAGL